MISVCIKILLLFKWDLKLKSVMGHIDSDNTEFKFTFTHTSFSVHLFDQVC